MNKFPIVTKSGYFVELCTTPSVGTFSHLFCGPHNIRGAICPNCDKPLLRFLQIDCHDERVGLASCGLARIQLFFCWTCNVAQQPFFYSLAEDGGVRLLRYGKGGKVADFPYKDYPICFPAKGLRLVPLSPSEQQAIILLNQGRDDECGPIVSRERLFLPRHQIGGIPLLLQFDERYVLKCPSCGKPMPFLAEIGADSGEEVGFTRNPYVQVVYSICTSCHALGCYQACD